MTITDICNIALDRAGHDDEVSDYANDPTKLAQMLRRHYPIAAEYVLRRHTWKDAEIWGNLGPAEYTKTYTGASSGNNSGDADFVVDEAIEAFTPKRGIITVDGDAYAYKSWATSTFTLDGVTLSSTYDGTDNCVLTPNNYDDQYEYMYAEPSDALELLDLDNDDQNEFKVIGGYVYTNLYDATYGVRVRYIKDIRDEVSSAVVYAVHVGDAIAAELAYRIAPRNADSRELIGLLLSDKETVLDASIAMDARGQLSEPEERTRWVDR